MVSQLGAWLLIVWFKNTDYLLKEQNLMDQDQTAKMRLPFQVISSDFHCFCSW